MRVSLIGELTIETASGVLGEKRLPGRQGRVVLAYLTSENGRPVPRDELADALWGDRLPATWEKALTVIVSKLRALLDECGLRGSEVLTHAFGCYQLVLPPGSWIDLTAAKAAVEDAELALADGRLDEAKTQAMLAATLTRQPFLPGEASEWVDTKRRELGDLLLRALDCLAQTCLLLGQPREAVRSAEEAVELEPFKESGYRLLMSAHAAAGDPAEALRVYERCRTVLDIELGASPSAETKTLHLEILREPGAAAATREAVWTAPPDRGSFVSKVRRHRPILLAGAALLAAAIGFVAAEPLRGVHEPAALAPAANGLAAIGTRSAHLLASVPLDSTGGALAYGHGAVWTTSPVGGTVERIDPKTHAVVDTIPVGLEPTGVAASSSGVWVANSGEGTVSRVNPATDRVVQTIGVGNGPADVAVGLGAVWVTNRLDGTVSRLDQRTGIVTRTVRVGASPSGVATGHGSVWVTDEASGTVSRLDPTSESVQIINVGNGPGAIVAGVAGVWIANELDGTVMRIDPHTNAVVATIPLGSGPLALATESDNVWIARTGSGSISRIDAGSGRVSRTLRLSAAPERLLAGGPGTLWVATGAPAIGHRGGTLRVLAAAAAFDTFDPATAYASSSWQALSMTNDGLVGFRRVGGVEGATLVPDLALSLPVPSDNGLTYAFRLRPGVRYANGEPVRAGDLRHAIERVLALGSPGSSYYEVIRGAALCKRSCDLSRGIVADDAAGTITFHLAHPDQDFLYKLALPFAFAVPRSTPESPARQALPATGPYQVRSYVPGRQLVLVRNPRFREWSQDAQPAGHAAEIVWALGGSPSSSVTAVERGRADVFQSGPPQARIDRILTRFAPQLHVYPQPSTFFLFLNTRRRPFDDARVRQAIAFAVDRERVVQMLQGPLLAQPTCQVLPPSFPGYRPYCPNASAPARDGLGPEPNLAAARRLVRISGTAGTRVVVWGFHPYEPVGRYVVTLLDRLGYDASFKLVSPQAFFARAADSRNGVQAGAYYWQTDFPAASDMLAVQLSCNSFQPGSSANVNISEFCDPGVDRAMQRASVAQVTSSGSASPQWAAVDRRLVDEAPIVPLANFRGVDFVSRRFGNYAHHPVYGVLLAQAWVR